MEYARLSVLPHLYGKSFSRVDLIERYVQNVFGKSAKFGEAKMIKVILIDDHALIRQGVLHMLQDTREIQVVGEAGSGIETVQLVRELRPQVVI